MKIIRTLKDVLLAVIIPPVLPKPFSLEVMRDLYLLVLCVRDLLKLSFSVHIDTVRCPYEQENKVVLSHCVFRS